MGWIKVQLNLVMCVLMAFFFSAPPCHHQEKKREEGPQQPPNRLTLHDLTGTATIMIMFVCLFVTNY